MNVSKRFVALYGLIVFAILLVFAILFAKERIIFTDAANYLFFSTQSKGFTIAHHRFIAYLFEFPYVFAIQQHLALKTVMLSYSIGYFVPDILVFLILFFGFKDYNKALILVLLWVVGNNYDYFYTATEFHKGIYLLLIFWCCLERYLITKNKKYPIVLFLLLIVLIFTHPLIIFPLAFIVVNVYFKDKYYKNNIRYYITLVASIVFIIAFKLIFFKSAHENAKYEFLNGFIKGFPYFNSNLSHTFFSYMFSHELTFIALIVFNIYILIKNNNRKFLFVFLSFFFFYWLLVVACYYTYTYDYYIEHLCKPLVFFTVSIFCIEVVPTINKKIVLMLLIIIAVYGVLKIKHTAKFYANHQHKIEEILHKMEAHNIQKGYMEAQHYTGMLNDERWNSAVESLLLSAYANPKKSKTVSIEYGFEQVGKDTYGDNSCFYTGYKINIDDLNTDYYHLAKDNFYIKIDSFLIEK